MCKICRAAMASKIAAALFTDGLGERASTLQMHIEPKDSGHPWRNLGGWNFATACEQIDKVLAGRADND